MKISRNNIVNDRKIEKTCEKLDFYLTGTKRHNIINQYEKRGSSLHQSPGVD